MDVMSALICVHSLQVCHMPYDMVFIHNTIPSQHITCVPCDLQSLPTGVSLDHRDSLRRKLTLVHQLTHTQASLKPQRNFSQCIGHLELWQLISSERSVELLAIQLILAGKL